VDAIVDDVVYQLSDVSQDARWPAFGRRAAFDEESPAFLQLLAAYGVLVASAVDDQDRARHLEYALTSNRDIGIAIGVLMATHKITRDRAFDMLRVVSQRTNRKMRDLATEVAETGVLADASVEE
jgi:hypothetical protein